MPNKQAKQELPSQTTFHLSNCEPHVPTQGQGRCVRDTVAQGYFVAPNSHIESTPVSRRHWGTQSRCRGKQAVNRGGSPLCSQFVLLGNGRFREHLQNALPHVKSAGEDRDGRSNRNGARKKSRRVKNNEEGAGSEEESEVDRESDAFSSDTGSIGSLGSDLETHEEDPLAAMERDLQDAVRDRAQTSIDR